MAGHGGAAIPQRRRLLSVLAIVPARGGSKGVPRKNVRLVAGRPLVAWTIDAALGARSVGRVVVSTDDAEIAEVARRCGAEVPVLRPAELARDDTPGVEPALHIVEWLDANEGYRPENVVLLQPTSPLRTAGDIEDAVRLMEARGESAIVGVTPVTTHPAWMKLIASDGTLVDAPDLTQAETVRQHLAPLYVINGAIYLVARDVLLKRRSFYAERTLAYVMPPDRSLDVDSAWDLRVAELELAARQQRGGV
jgi:N-acylneuraminate cytidylyltransferase/CMP-N,N'-diacetyllegionaminic acid synthase